MPQMIKLESVTKSFDAVLAVDNISFSVGTGEVVGLLGPNGAGKTTTMRLITGYYSADSGSIEVDGVDPMVDPIEVHRSVGYLPENNPLYDDMLAGEYLQFVAELRGMPRNERRTGIAQAAAETGVDDVLNRPIGELSKGYRQRTGLAAATLMQPKVLVLDEPTEGLDPNQRADIRSLIRQVGKKRTVLVSTHVLAEVQSTCDRALVIANGQLVADATIADLTRTAAGVRLITVEAKGRGVKKGLTDMAGKDAVTQVPAESRRQRYTVSVEGDVDLRPEIFRYAAAHGWELYELHEERASLEEVFHSLTRTAE
jgi:gliding motility-associated transport system ATP-binding protein